MWKRIQAWWHRMWPKDVLTHTNDKGYADAPNQRNTAG